MNLDIHVVIRFYCHLGDCCGLIVPFLIWNNSVATYMHLHVYRLRVKDAMRLAVSIHLCGCLFVCYRSRCRAIIPLVVSVPPFVCLFKVDPFRLAPELFKVPSLPVHSLME